MRAVSSRSRLWYVFYAVCLAFVVSFVLFEVLDIDGSDFRFLTTPARGALKSTNEEHEADLRRACVLAAQLTSLTAAVAPLQVVTMTTRLEHVASVPRLAVVVAHENRIALPRASLGEAAPSA
ncbi:MAG: hypothetical protein AUH29_05805 [Candidatus Rokubacteria bacterium 13_1_40CM_69_27]|nr:MAG: hypothetical protein AUH29_05805 [Candidatus Rokubacteria bacterium 13_1_40CM_69_27]OLC30226.1 MAG: hypothetical protein AUH81_20690 [Candidatus Rokubacteria bacterium 13_1_40CM_4_69_5]